MVARLASIADGTKRLQVRVLRWSLFPVFISSDGRIHLILTKSGNTHSNAITSELNGQNANIPFVYAKTLRHERVS